MSAKLKIKRGLLDNWESSTVELEPGQLALGYRSGKTPRVKVGGGDTGTANSTWSNSKFIAPDTDVYTDTALVPNEAGYIIGGLTKCLSEVFTSNISSSNGPLTLHYYGNDSSGMAIKLRKQCLAGEYVTAVWGSNVGGAALYPILENSSIAYQASLGTPDHPWTAAYANKFTNRGTDVTILESSDSVLQLTSEVPQTAAIDVFNARGNVTGENSSVSKLRLTTEWRYLTTSDGTTVGLDSLYQNSLVLKSRPYLSADFYPENGSVFLGSSTNGFAGGYFQAQVQVGYSTSDRILVTSGSIQKNTNSATSLSSNSNNNLALRSNYRSVNTASNYYSRGNISFEVNSKYGSRSAYNGYLFISKEDSIAANGGVLISSTTSSSDPKGTGAELHLKGSSVVMQSKLVPFTGASYALGDSARPFSYLYSVAAVHGPHGITFCETPYQLESNYRSKITAHASSFTDNSLKYQGLTILCTPPGQATADVNSPYLNNAVSGCLALELETKGTSVYNGAYTASTNKASLLFEGHGYTLGVYPELDSLNNRPGSYFGNLVKPWAVVSTQQLNLVTYYGFVKGAINNTASLFYDAIGGEWGKGSFFISFDAPDASIDKCPAVYFDADSYGHIWIHANETGAATSTGGGGATASMLYFGSNTTLARNVYTQLVCAAEKIYPMSNDTATLGSSGARWKEVWCKTSSCTTSDRREKDSIKYLDDGDAAVTREQVVDFVKKMKPTTFVLKHSDVEVATEDNSPDSYIQIGFIAQDLEDIDAKMFQRVGSKAPVVEGEDDTPTGDITYSLQDLPLTATAIVAIQEVMRENEELKARLAAIEEKLSKL